MVPYTGELQCIACHRSIGLYNRAGELVGMEVHNPHSIVDDREYLGPGQSGFGMFLEKRRLVCGWRKE